MYSFFYFRAGRTRWFVGKPQISFSVPRQTSFAVSGRTPNFFYDSTPNFFCGHTPISFRCPHQISFPLRSHARQIPFAVEHQISFALPRQTSFAVEHQISFTTLVLFNTTIPIEFVCHHNVWSPHLKGDRITPSGIVFV